MPAFKVVHISASRSGGAGRAAYRIHEALVRNGIDSKFIALDQTGPKWPRPLVKKNFLVQKIHWRLRTHFNIEMDLRRRYIEEFESLLPVMNCEAASLPFCEYDLPDPDIIGEADIIHFHWVPGDIEYRDFFRTIKKPLVWTFHDMNPILGLFHYKEDMTRNSRIAGKLDKAILNFKKTLLKNYRGPLTVVCPSEWLVEEVGKSTAFKKRKINKIPNSLNLDIFKFRDKSIIREKIGIPRQKIVLIAIAENTANFRKGFDLLISSIKHLNILTLLLIGHSVENRTENRNIIFLGSVKDDNLLAEYLSVADATIIPSREDNLPNVMLESLACGTPIISFKVGGMMDHIKNFETGLLAEEMTSESLGEAIHTFLADKERFDRKFIRKYAVEHFNENLIAGQYIEVYNNLLNA